MNRVLLNTLYVMQPEGYLRLDNDTVRVELEGETKLRVPLHHLGGIVARGSVLLSPHLLGACAERGIGVTWLDRRDRFAGALRGPTHGNVLLRLAHFESWRDPAVKLGLARVLVAGKVKNARNTLVRRARDAEPQAAAALREARAHLDTLLQEVPRAESLEAARGYEGAAARVYFGALNALTRPLGFALERRTRRPPLDPMNALLSFVYTLVTGDCVAACEGVGLDPQVGWLHEVRPGRPAAALDLAEELRSALADRLVLTLLHRRQVKPDDFEAEAGGAVRLTDAARKVVLTAYQQRKQEEVPHPLLEERVPFGLVPHLQARLLARHLRGDAPVYLPFAYV